MGVRLYAIVRFRRRRRRGAAKGDSRKPVGSLPQGLAGERLRIASCAVGSIVFAYSRGAIAPTAENLVAYAGVLESLGDRSEAILPARFGVVAPTAAALRSQIDERGDSFERALRLVSGRVQMRLFLKITNRKPEGKKTAGVLRRKPGKYYLQSLADALDPPPLRSIRRLVDRLVKAERVEPAGQHLRIYHLVDREDAEKYRAIVRPLEVSGPFPPYAFVPGIDRAAVEPHDESTKKGCGPNPRDRQPADEAPETPPNEPPPVPVQDPPVSEPDPPYTVGKKDITGEGVSDLDR